MTDDDLIAHIKRRKAGGHRIDRECDEFYRRHKDYLVWAVRLNPAARLYGVESLAHDTLTRFLERVDRYRCEELGEDQSRRNVRAYLGTIARRLANARTKEASLNDLLDAGVQLVPPEPAGSSRDGALARLRSCLHRLQPRDQTILLVSVLYWDTKSEQPRIPAEQLDELCRRVGLSKEALRARRHRALSQLRGWMEEEAE